MLLSSTCAGEQDGFKRSSVLTIGDSLGCMQLIEMSADTEQAVGAGVLYVWPSSDAACNLAPARLDLGGGLLAEFASLAVRGSRHAGHTQQLWTWLCDLCGGSGQLEGLGIGWPQFQPLARHVSTVHLLQHMWHICSA